MNKNLLLFFGMLVLISCDVKKNELSEALLNNRAKWENHSFESYWFDFEIYDGVSDTMVFRMTVLDDTTAKTVYLYQNRFIDVNMNSIDDFFDIIETAERDSTVDVTAVYDSELGYPLEITRSKANWKRHRILRLFELVPNFDYKLFSEMKRTFSENEPQNYKYVITFRQSMWREHIPVEVRGDSIYLENDTAIYNDENCEYSIYGMFLKIDELAEKLGEPWGDDALLKDVAVSYDTTTGIPLWVSHDLHFIKAQRCGLDASRSISQFEIIEK